MSDITSAGKDVGEDAIKSALNDVLSSPCFMRKKRQSHFLQFVVEEVLAGRGDGLKEVTIAPVVFKKSSKSSESGDRSVAVCAGNLRKLLEAYYNSGDGRKQKVRIDIPVGTYRPSFSWNIGTDREKLAEAFRVLFFGRGEAWQDETPGTIVVQSDEIDTCFEELLERVDPAQKDKGQITADSRLYKARTWVNRWDVEGALAIQDAFRAFEREGIRTPRLALRNRHIHRRIHSKTPYLISMGLGFTGRSTIAVKQCIEWMNNRVWNTDVGDALSLHEGLLRGVQLENPRILPAKNGFCRLVPSDWDEADAGSSYMRTWLDMRREVDLPEVNDYAMIFRHTETRATYRRVLLTLAGFTERGTAIAGHYLAANWENLSRRYIQDQPPESLGDFLLLIEGPSDPDPDGLVDHWSEVLAVTPKSLYDAGIACAWQRRIGPLPEATTDASSQ